jgi:nicotinate dehydrogenase subunit B
LEQQVKELRSDAAAPRVPEASSKVTSHSTPFGSSLNASSLLSQWVTFVPGRRVMLRVGKVELGQGIVTALTQIAADELDVQWSRVEAVPAATSVSPDEGLTAGSRSIMDSGSAVRAVCAEVRLRLVALAAALAGVPEQDLWVSDGEIRDAAGSVLTDYWSLMEPGLLDVELSGSAAPKDPRRNLVVGRSVQRPDLLGKLTGLPGFVHDMVLPGQLFGRIVRPPSPAACLLAVDVASARALPSVVAVVREGSFLGVVAQREEEAVRAAALLASGASWQESDTLPDQTSWTRELLGQPAEESVVDRRRDPTASARTVEVMRAEYRRPYTAHASIGPGCAVARWDGGAVSVWCHSQGIYPLRRALGEALNMDPELVVVHHVPGAGCYGHNSADDVAYDAVLLARAVPGRPVQVVWSRDDEFAWEPFGPAMVASVAIGVDESGYLLSWQQDVWGTGHDSRPGFFGQPGLLGAWHAVNAPPVVASDPPAAIGGGTGRNAAPPYSVADLDVRAHRLIDMPLRTSALRGLGAVLNTFAIESAMDELAERIGADPLEYRLRQLPDERARQVLQAVADEAGWADRNSEESVGWGLAYSRYKGICGYCAVVARVEAISHVRVSDIWIAADVGQVINPDGLANQLQGGAIQATSWVLREQVTFDSRTITSRDWDSYPILRFGEVPEVHVSVVPRPDEAPLGAGELAGGPVAAALANALADAVGVRVRELPLTPGRIAATIEAG